MCLICYSPKAQGLDRDLFRRANDNNPDGIGVMSAKGAKRFHDKKQEQRAWDHCAHLADLGIPYAVHFRLGTHGDNGVENVHPFESADGSWVMHNGVMHFASVYAEKGQSDTRAFVDLFMGRIPEPDEDAEYVAKVLLYERAIGDGNKLLILHGKSKRFSIVNEQAGFWAGDIWYSNNWSHSERMDSIVYRWPEKKTNGKGSYTLRKGLWEDEAEILSEYFQKPRCWWCEESMHGDELQYEIAEDLVVCADCFWNRFDAEERKDLVTENGKGDSKQTSLVKV